MDVSGGGAEPRSVPDLILWSRPGCHLCDDAREMLEALLRTRAAENRPVPHLVERDITTNPEWERRFLVTIPVVELGERLIELATSVNRLRALLATLDADVPAVADAARG